MADNEAEFWVEMEAKNGRRFARLNVSMLMTKCLRLWLKNYVNGKGAMRSIGRRMPVLPMIVV